MNLRKISLINFLLLAFPVFCLAISSAAARPSSGETAPNGPGDKPFWTSGNKQGLGTSITAASHVWFTLGDGALNEVYYPTVDKANTRDLELIITDGKSFADLESQDTVHTVSAPDEAALVFRQVNTAKSGRYRITKTYVTDPKRNVLLIHLQMEVLTPGVPLRAFVYYDPSLNNSGMHDTGYSQGDALVASKPQSMVDANAANAGATPGDVSSALAAKPAFVRTTTGFVGVSDGLGNLKRSYSLNAIYSRAVDGNIAQIGELPASFCDGRAVTLALSFENTDTKAIATARAGLTSGFSAVEKEYASGWHKYVSSLKQPEPQYKAMYQRAAMVLRAHEDKIHPGAIVASLTIPWGNDADASLPTIGGYHLVWSRDLYEIATAFIAMGDTATAGRALDYLLTTQQKPDGSFPQNSWLNGKPYWGSLQMDEIAFPIVLAWQLNRTDAKTYQDHLRPAANYVVAHGPSTPQERWEEQGGYSPSTIAAEIAGLICAADIARRNGDAASAEAWTKVADDWAVKLNGWTVTTTGKYAPEYFVRIAQNGKPNSGEMIELKNGGGTWDEREIVDAGFVELVRLGVLRPDDKVVLQSLAVVDQVIKVETPSGPGWHRYNHDGYGEQPNGGGYLGVGIGGLWPLFAGERGEYEIANGRDARFYLDTMVKMSNEGGLLSEQVWGLPQSPAPTRLILGRPTGSANPLAWTTAQFIRLALAEKQHSLPDMPSVVREHFQGAK